MQRDIQDRKVLVKKKNLLRNLQNPVEKYIRNGEQQKQQNEKEAKKKKKESRQ